MPAQLLRGKTQAQGSDLSHEKPYDLGVKWPSWEANSCSSHRVTLPPRGPALAWSKAPVSPGLRFPVRATRGWTVSQEGPSHALVLWILMLSSNDPETICQAHFRHLTLSLEREK